MTDRAREKGLRRGEANSGPGSAASSRTAISPARLAAFEILERVATTSDHSDDLLHGRRLEPLSQLDRNLATTLVLGVLRWQIALDSSIRPLLQRPELALAQPILTALRLGAFQLLYLDRIPAHAALSESVELVRAAGQAHAAGMVNAVLRKLTRTAPQGLKIHESTAAFAERLGHPLWLMERWSANYGRKAAMAICEYDQKEPHAGGLFVVEAESRPYNDSKSLKVEYLQGEENLSHAEENPSAMVENLPRLDDGSRLVAEIAAASAPEARRIWDCCAAPGGKTILLAHRHPQAELLASDVSPQRLKALAARLESNGVITRFQTLLADASAHNEEVGMFDLILCDVPCSGTGTLARNPEIRHHLRPGDLARRAARQTSILRAALGRLAPGGRLLYSTCSLEPEENDAVVDAVLAGLGSKAVQREDIGPVLERLREQGVVAPGTDVSGLVRGGYLRTLPGVGFQGDGFFAALFVVR